jgi:hypothetical protein
VGTAAAVRVDTALVASEGTCIGFPLVPVATDHGQLGLGALGRV